MTGLDACGVWRSADVCMMCQGLPIHVNGPFFLCSTMIMTLGRRHDSSRFALNMVRWNKVRTLCV
jgi:hypothetical protein